MKFADWFYHSLFGYPLPKPEPFRGIVGVTEDGCYLIDRGDGQIVKSHPIRTAEHVKREGEFSWTFHRDCQCSQCRYADAQIQTAKSRENQS